MTASIETPFNATVTPIIDLNNATTIATLRNTLGNLRDNVRSLFEQINDHIKDEKLSKTDDISIKFLGEVLLDVFNSELLFLREYEVEVVHSIKSTVFVTASDEDEARQLAEEIGISSIEWDYDENVVTPDSDWVIFNTHVDQIGER